jgi:Leucine-rich repeat (LRR) protein
MEYLMPLAMSTHWLQTSIPPGGSADSLLNSLLMVSDQVTWLDLRSTPTTDHGLSFIAQFKNLTRLHLNNTEISGKGLHHLGNLPYLEYLNLYGTQVNDKDIQQLASLKNLKRLYLWQTQVTEEGAAQLQKSLPGLQVNLGIGNGEVAQ